MNPGAIYGAALERATAPASEAGTPLARASRAPVVPPVVRDAGGASWPLALDLWLGTATAADERALSRAVGPVLDVGCGPGRHVHALARRGVFALGVDIAPAAVRHARRGGARVVEGSIFGPLPGPGSWRTALLLDGNIGIGGRPALLLRRIGELLRPDGQVLVELDPDDGATGDPRRVRLEDRDVASAWFTWARVAPHAIDRPARAAGMRLVDRWDDDGRRFCALARS